MKTKHALPLAFLALIPLLIGAPAVGATPRPASATTPYPGGRWEPPAAAYGEYDVHTWVTMPDGTRLEATIGYPADPSTGQRARGRFPVIFQHSPYTDVPDPFFVTRGYIFVNVRPRGTGDSDGVVTQVGPADANDAKTLIPWAAALPGSNGKVGQIGCSYPGYYAWADAATIGPNSPLKASVIQCITGGLGSWSEEGNLDNGFLTTAYPGGSAFCTYIAGENFGGTPRPSCLSAAQALLQNALAGGDLAYDRNFYKEREQNVPEQIVHNGIPVLMMSNWGDRAPQTSLWDYAQFQNAYAGRDPLAPMSAKQKTTPRYQLVMGPSSWGHGVGLDDGIAMEWFDTWLKGTDTGLQSTDVGIHAYEQPTDQWVNVNRYPVIDNYSQMFLSQGATLTAQKPAATTGSSDAIAWGQPSDSGTTLTYQTAPFTSGATLAGPMAATVYASSSNTNLQLVFTLYDVAPDGTATAIYYPYRYSAILGSQRALNRKASWTDAHGDMIKPYIKGYKDDYLTPNKVAQLDVELPSAIWSIEPGHSLRLSIATQIPTSLCDTATGVQVYACVYTAPQQRTLPGGQYTIVRSAQRSSSIQLPLLPYHWLTPVSGGSTPSSNGFTEPLDWTTSSEPHAGRRG